MKIAACRLPKPAKCINAHYIFATNENDGSLDYCEEFFRLPQKCQFAEELIIAPLSEPQQPTGASTPLENN